MSVYNCYDCNTVLCKDCSRKHNDENKNQIHLMQLISNSFILNFKFRVTPFPCRESTSDIKCLPNGELIVSIAMENAVTTFSIIGIQRHSIHLENIPVKITVVDKNTVAVLLMNRRLAIVDIQQNHVLYIRNIAIPYSSDTLIYIENEFYISDEYGIVVIDMSGIVKRHFKLSFIPYDMCYDDDSQHIYCIGREYSQLLCIDTKGTIVFTFTDPSMTSTRDLTIDNEGNVLVLCRKIDDNSSYVIKVDSNGGKSEVVITNITTLYYIPNICYNHFTNSVVIAVHDTVYNYKKQ